MCGIVGYAGHAPAAPVLLEGLSRLEYRGYDSAGIGVLGEQGLTVIRAKGRLQALVDRIGDGMPAGCTGIGHTRWATHGEPSERNAHPQVSASGKIAVVHNGILENEGALRSRLQEQGIVFRSETDTEVAANLIGYYYDRCPDLVAAVRQAVARLEGSYALGIVCADRPGTVVAVAMHAPLIFGFGDGENFIASDIPALLKFTQTVARLEDGDMVLFNSRHACFLTGEGDPVERKRETVSWELGAAERGGYDHFMLKEIFEQPAALAETLRPRIREGKVTLPGIDLPEPFLRSLRKIYLVACGSAYYVGVLGKYTLEKACRIPTEAVLASEFRYSDPVVDERNLVIVISQSGETADTLEALREAGRRGAQTLAIVNVVGSAIAKAAAQVLYTWAGPEIAVATTKAFTAQLGAVYLLALYLAERLGTVPEEEYRTAVAALEHLPEDLRQTLTTENLQKLRYHARRYRDRRDAFYIGRNLDSAVCLEGSLKLKEVAYLHSEAYPAGELKHGPISLIEEGTLVVAAATVEPLFPKTLANIREVKARGADVLCLTLERLAPLAETAADGTVTVPEVYPMFQPSLTLIPLQLFAYDMAVERGCDVDKPRNLAKSVTVE